MNQEMSPASEAGLIGTRFQVCGMEVGKFSGVYAKMIVYLLKYERFLSVKLYVLLCSSSTGPSRVLSLKLTDSLQWIVYI